MPTGTFNTDALLAAQEQLVEDLAHKAAIRETDSQVAAAEQLSEFAAKVAETAVASVALAAVVATNAARIQNTATPFAARESAPLSCRAQARLGADHSM